MTECFAKIPKQFLVKKKELCINFNAGRVSSDGGALLLKALDDRLGFSEDLASCLKDRRDKNMIKHTMEDLFRTRLYLIALGYEDCDDADLLRYDPVFLTALDRLPEGKNGLPSQPTLCRFENGVLFEDGLRWRDLYRLSCVFLERFIKSYANHAPKDIVIEIDSTDYAVHGNQQLSFFNGYYDKDCYLPYYIYATVDWRKEHFLGAVLRPGNSSTSRGSLGILKRLISRLKKTFRGVKIVLRLDAGFAFPELYEWAEAFGVDVEYAIRFPKNDRLLEAADVVIKEAKKRYETTKTEVCIYEEVRYRADGWPYRRRVVCKVKIDESGEMNCLFILTNMTWGSQSLFEFYNKRGDFENRIKEMKLGIKAGRTSCSSFKANQLRLILYAASYLLYVELRRYLKDTSLGTAQVETIRAKLLKLGTLVKESVRRVWVMFSSHFTLQELFMQTLVRIRGSTA